jgi:hypothetical protein
MLSPFESGLADFPIEEKFECVHSLADSSVEKEKENPRNLALGNRYTTVVVKQ